MGGSNQETSKEELYKIIDEALEMSKTSYNQENERSKQLLNKSDYLIKYISAIFIFVNIFLPLAFSNSIINLVALSIMYFLISAPLIFSLFYAVRAQILKPGDFFPLGEKILLKIKNREYKKLFKIRSRHIMYYSKSTEKLQSSNDDRAKLLKKAYWSYIFSVCMLAIIILIIMILIA